MERHFGSMFFIVLYSSMFFYMDNSQSVETMTAVIIDDEASAINVLQSLLERIGRVEVVATAQNPNIGLREVMVHQPDFIFLDVQMEQKSGIELLQEIKQLSVDSSVIMVSGYDDYTFDAFKNGASDYLIKPVSLDVLTKTLCRVHNTRNESKTIGAAVISDDTPLIKEDGNYISTRSSRGSVDIPTSSIVYLKAAGSYSEIHLKDGKVFTCTRGLWLLERELPNYFFKIHRSTMVNVNFVSRIDAQEQMCHLAVDNYACDLVISKVNITALRSFMDERL